jgi:hypothetical protein
MDMIDPHFSSRFAQAPLPQKQKFVKSEEYATWRRNYLFDALRGMRYGQSFCENYGITDYVLYYMTKQPNADLYIRKYFVI